MVDSRLVEIKRHAARAQSIAQEKTGTDEKTAHMTPTNKTDSEAVDVRCQKDSPATKEELSKIHPL